MVYVPVNMCVQGENLILLSKAFEIGSGLAFLRAAGSKNFAITFSLVGVCI